MKKNWIHTPEFAINWVTDSIKLNPDNIRESYEQWQKTDDEYCVVALVEPRNNVWMRIVHIGDARDSVVNCSSLYLEIPTWLDASAENRDYLAVYVLERGNSERMISIFNTRMTEDRTRPWFEPADQPRGLSRNETLFERKNILGEK